AMFRAKPLSFLLLLVGLLGGAAAAAYFMLVAPTRDPVFAIIGGVVGFAALMILISWRIASGGEELEITNKRTMGRTGILSKATSDVMHKDIRNIQVRQSFRDRLM